ncbi:MAG: hypothetical protein ACTS22_03775 [Phycisphaerales bacterium]
MQVLLDGREIGADQPTLAAAVEAGRLQAEASGRVITEVIVNGEAVQGELLNDPARFQAEGAEIRLTSSDPVELVSSSLLQAADALASTRTAHARLAEQIQVGLETGTLEALSETLSTWQAAQDVLLQGWALLGRDPMALRPPEESGAPSVEAMVEALVGELKSIKRALQDGDMAAIADSIGYELEPMTERWASLLRAAASQARDADAP